MSALRLSENLMPLLMHIDPILATAEQFGLGEKVDVSLVDHEAVFIRSAQQNWQVVFNAHHQDQSCDILLRVLD
ncbi:hypothetical protein Q8W14_09300 [Photobacterium damselae subsp. piscicida]|nr:hypothetical protein [Photobacterium damselae subsp. piscicida]